MREPNHTCVICGQPFYANYSTARYCSGRCRKQAAKDRQLADAEHQAANALTWQVRVDIAERALAEARTALGAYADPACWRPDHERPGSPLVIWDGRGNGPDLAREALGLPKLSKEVENGDAE